MDEIGRLTPYAVKYIFFRDPHEGSPSQPAPKGPSHKEVFWITWKKWRGFSEEETQTKWDAYVRENPLAAS